MDHSYLSDTVGSAPTPPATPATGFPTDGDPVAGQEATSPGAYWYYMITESIRRVIVAAGGTPDHANLDQLKAAVSGAWRTATEALAGILRVATQAETDAGTADDRAVTPKKLRSGFAVSLAGNGYIALPSWAGGWMVQWGAASAAAGTGSVTLPQTFPTACQAVFTHARQTQRYVDVPAVGLSSFTSHSYDTTSGASASASIYFFAIGY